MNRQTDLFQNPKEHKSFDLSGFGMVDYYPSFFEQKESDRYFKNLSDKITWRQDKIKIIGKEINLPRLTAWYGEKGFNYTYSGIKMNPLPWNDDLLKIKDLIENIAKVSFNSVLLNLYRTGNDSVSWHSDDEKEIDKNSPIASVSFGAIRDFQLKHKQDKTLKRIDIPLAHGSLLLMQPPTQEYWLHQLPKRKKVTDPRINLTFRVIT
mgnify:CR=1 FL=1